MKTANTSWGALLHPILLLIVATLVCFLIGGGQASAKDKKGKNNLAEREASFAEMVWPPPPDEARIRLLDVISGRLDVEASSKFKQKLLGASPQAAFDVMNKPHAVALDSQGRLLVSDSEAGAIFRYDRQGRRMDVLGTTGNLRLKTPMGMTVDTADITFVADPGQGRVVALDPEGSVVSVFGRQGELTNPTDVALSHDEMTLYITDSKAHEIVVIDRQTANVVNRFGSAGTGHGQFSFPSAVAVTEEGDLLVVDQLNARVVLMDTDGEQIDALGSLGTSAGNFVRPKAVAVDENGFIYVTDFAFNNVQIFDADFTLLTFVGSGGVQPGQFKGISGVSARDGRFALVDQLGRRVQLFQYLNTTETP